MSKNILVFMDGTRNKSSDKRVLKDTNVWKLYEASAVTQLGQETYAKYVRGVGTAREERVSSPADELRLFRIRHWSPPTHAAKRVRQFARELPGRVALKYGASAVGWGVADRIREAYEFICRHYERGDLVYLFGFSRGAFEARSLSGFIDAVGLLLRAQAVGPDARRLVDQAYEIYRRGDQRSLRFLGTFLRRMTGFSRPATDDEFRRTPRFLRPTAVRLHFIGVWDTVEALGLGEVKLGKFELNNKSLPVVGPHTTYHLAASLPLNVEHGRHAMAIHELRTRFEPLLWEAPGPGQDLKQVWFAGAHADVGGGYPDTRLSDIALNWMAQEATALGGKAHPVTFKGLPRRISAAKPLQPHQAIQGDFFWATPAPRGHLSGQVAVTSAVAATMSVHPTALERLFDVGATTYVDYPFEKDYIWSRHLPKGSLYPSNVSGVLTLMDDRTVKLQISSVTAAHAVTPGAKTLGFTIPGSSKLFLPRWMTLTTVAELQRATAWVKSAKSHFIESEVNQVEVVESLSILLAFDQRTAIDKFLNDMSDLANQLAAESNSSLASRLFVEQRGLPIFDSLCAVVGLLETFSPMSAQWKVSKDIIEKALSKSRCFLHLSVRLVKRLGNSSFIPLLMPLMCGHISEEQVAKRLIYLFEKNSSVEI